MDQVGKTGIVVLRQPVMQLQGARKALQWGAQYQM